MLGLSYSATDKSKLAFIADDMSGRFNQFTSGANPTVISNSRFMRARIVGSTSQWAASGLHYADVVSSLATGFDGNTRLVIKDVTHNPVRFASPTVGIFIDKQIPSISGFSEPAFFPSVDFPRRPVDASVASISKRWGSRFASDSQLSMLWGYGGRTIQIDRSVFTIHQSTNDNQYYLFKTDYKSSASVVMQNTEVKLTDGEFMPSVNAKNGITCPILFVWFDKVFRNLFVFWKHKLNSLTDDCNISCTRIKFRNGVWSTPEYFKNSTSTSFDFSTEVLETGLSMLPRGEDTAVSLVCTAVISGPIQTSNVNRRKVACRLKLDFSDFNHQILNVPDMSSVSMPTGDIIFTESWGIDRKYNAHATGDDGSSSGWSMFSVDSGTVSGGLNRYMPIAGFRDSTSQSVTGIGLNLFLPFQPNPIVQTHGRLI